MLLAIFELAEISEVALALDEDWIFDDAVVIALECAVHEVILPAARIKVTIGKETFAHISMTQVVSELPDIFIFIVFTEPAKAVFCKQKSNSVYQFEFRPTRVLRELTGKLSFTLLL
mgnify:CR=1 FL=1